MAHEGPVLRLFLYLLKHDPGVDPERITPRRLDLLAPVRVATSRLAIASDAEIEGGVAL